MNRKRKILAICLSVHLSIASVPPQEAEASWFSDLCGGLFTFITAPIWVFCQDNPTFRKNNPFRKKVWEEQAEEQERIERERTNVSNYHKKRESQLEERLKEIEEQIEKNRKEEEERFKQIGQKQLIAFMEYANRLHN